jgi:hypothetical protein
MEIVLDVDGVNDAKSAFVEGAKAADTFASAAKALADSNRDLARSWSSLKSLPQNLGGGGPGGGQGGGSVKSSSTSPWSSLKDAQDALEAAKNTGDPDKVKAARYKLMRAQQRADNAQRFMDKQDQGGDT